MTSMSSTSSTGRWTVSAGLRAHAAADVRVCASVIPRPVRLVPVSRDTFVIVARSQPLSAEAFPPGSGFARRGAGSEVEALLAEGDPIILTDRHAPVKQMLAPVFLEMVE